MRLAGASGLALLIALGQARAAQQPMPDGMQSLPDPLSAQDFTAAVLAHNATLEAMRQAVIAAVAQIRPAGALDDPRLSVSVAPASFGSSAMTPGADIEVSQTLPWWGSLEAKKDAARAEAAAAGYDLDGLRLRLTALARGAFSDWVYVRRALDINAANQSVLDQLRSIARVRYATGQAPQTDVLQADFEHGMLRQQQLEWERQRSLVLSRMNALLDRAPQAAIPPPTQLPSVVPLQAEELLEERALAHPQLQQLAAQEQAAEAHEQLAEKERYPTFGVSAAYNNMWPQPAMRPMVGISFSVPLDQAKYRDEINAARAQAHRAASTLEQQRVNLLAELAGDYASVQEAAQSLSLYGNELVPLARATLEVARSEYASGRGSFLDVLTAEQHRLDTELGLARAQSDYFERLADLDEISGSDLPAGGSNASVRPQGVVP
jgi:outer membrane protein TolC